MPESDSHLIERLRRQVDWSEVEIHPEESQRVVLRNSEWARLFNLAAEGAKR